MPVDALGPVAMVMPVSVPVPRLTSDPPCQERLAGRGRGWRRGKRRAQNRPPPLLLHPSPCPAPCPSPCPAPCPAPSPAPTPSLATRGASLYRSLLRVAASKEEVSGGDGAAYTPPPMLCPVRAGTGLYCSLTTRGQQREQRGRLNTSEEMAESSVAKVTSCPREQPVEIKPRINVGAGFQAEVPPLQERRRADTDSHNAMQLWTPWDDLDTLATQQRVRAFLMMACSCVVPGGGISSEYALHALSESRGDFLVTLEKLLLQGSKTSPPCPLTPYHYPGPARWTAAERRLVNRALLIYHKDFSQVQTMVQTKSLAQCVEFYYFWKKRLGLKMRTPSEVAHTVPEGSEGPLSQLEGGTGPPSPNQKLLNLRSPDLLEPTANHIVSYAGGLSKGGKMSCGSSTPVLLERVKPSWTHPAGLVPPGSSPAPSSVCSSPVPQTTTLYPCKECSKVFTKVKSRNAHMKTHRHHEGSPAGLQIAH